MSAVVLDASALLAMIKEESGGDKVAKVIGEARMSVVNFAEVVSHFVRNGMPPGDVDAMLRPLPVTLVPADAELSRLAGYLRGPTAEAGLSLGDRFCLALAVREKLPAWTADRTWKSVARKLRVDLIAIR